MRRWEDEGPEGTPSVREFMSSISDVFGVRDGPFSEAEVEVMRSRLLLDESGEFKRMPFYEYLHHCYWGCRQIAGDGVKLPSVVKKQGGQSMFANTFVVVPMQPLSGSLFLMG